MNSVYKIGGKKINLYYENIYEKNAFIDLIAMVPNIMLFDYCFIHYGVDDYIDKFIMDIFKKAKAENKKILCLYSYFYGSKLGDLIAITSTNMFLYETYLKDYVFTYGDRILREDHEIPACKIGTFGHVASYTKYDNVLLLTDLIHYGIEKFKVETLNAKRIFIENILYYLNKSLEDFINGKFIALDTLLERGVRLNIETILETPPEDITLEKYRQAFQRKIVDIQRAYELKAAELENAKKEMEMKYEQKYQEALSLTYNKVLDLLDDLSEKYDIVIKDRQIYIKVDLWVDKLMVDGVLYNVPEDKKKYFVKWLVVPGYQNRITSMYAREFRHPNISSDGCVCLGDLVDCMELPFTCESIDKIVEALKIANFDSAYQEDRPYIREIVSNSNEKNTWETLWEG